MDKETLAPFLKIVIPQYDWILSDMELNNGWISLNDNFIQFIINNKINWWKAYDNSNFYHITRLLPICDIETIKSIKTIEDALSLKREIENSAIEFINSEEGRAEFVPNNLNKQERKSLQDEIESQFNKLSQDEQAELIKNEAFSWLGLLPNFFNTISVMIHGKSLRNLVSSAKSGDDDHFVMAVQIDRTVLFLPYFQERVLRAQLSGDVNFLEKLSYRLKNPIIKGKIRRRTLWLLFALLDSENLLELPGPELMEICKNVNVYGDEFGNGSIKTLRKRRKEYFDNRGTRKYF